MDVGRFVARVRRDAGLTQRALAERVGTSAAAICGYERGDRVPRVDTLARIVEAAGAELVLDARPRAPIDLEKNAAILEQLLELADHLPRRAPSPLSCPPFREVAA